ncbi:MAG TPA: hypothetical protein VGF45_08500 [Polyangia bacterium]
MFFLKSASMPDVEAALARGGFVPNGDEGHSWHFRDGQLYATCSAFNPLDFDEEDLRLIFENGGREPLVTVQVDISGRIPGDSEVREVAELLLTSFDGLALDDYASHAWTIDEIRHKVVFEGLGFFDYAGGYKKDDGEPG